MFQPAVRFRSGLPSAWLGRSPTLNRCANAIRRQTLLAFIVCCATAFMVTGASLARAENPPPNTDTPKKANARPAAEVTATKADPFDGATVAKMTQCVTLDTEGGMIVIEMLP